MVQGADVALDQAIHASMQTHQAGGLPSLQYEPLPADQRLREANMPCGLRNIGNTCYFNSLLQVLFSLPQIVNPLLEFSPPAK